MADGEYAARRASCELATQILGVTALRDVAVDDLTTALARLPDGQLRRRARHVVTENDRLTRTVDHLRNDRMLEMGDLLTDSHRSLPDDDAASWPRAGRGRRES